MTVIIGRILISLLISQLAYAETYVSGVPASPSKTPSQAEDAAEAKLKKSPNYPLTCKKSAAKGPAGPSDVMVCGLKLPVEKNYAEMKKISAECEKEAISGLNDDFIRKHIKNYGANNKQTPESLANSIKTYETHIANNKKALENYAVLKLETANPTFKKKREAYKLLMAKSDALESEVQEKYAKAKSMEAKGKLLEQYHKSRAEIAKIIEEKYPNFSQINSIDSNIENTQSQIKSAEQQLDKLKTQLSEMIAKASEEPEQVATITTAERERVESEIRSNKLSIRMRDGFAECGLTDVELFAIYQYSGSAYGAINKALREGDEKAIARFQYLIDAINSGLSKIASHQETVRRGASIPSEQLKEYCEGCVVTMKAFTSSSTSSGFNGNQKFIIKSKNGAYIAGIAQGPGENEVLFKTNTKFKVLSIDGNNYTMEEVD